MKLTWINFLHFYQPANATDDNIREATEKSYLRIIRALEDHSHLNFTINITGCLLLRWEELGYLKIIKRIKTLIHKGQVEIVGSAAYHPLLPLVTAKEVIEQIKENEKILQKYFGKIKLNGFFLPEMAYSLPVAKIIKKLAYEWIIVDDFALGKNRPDFNIGYVDQSGLKVMFRSRNVSNSYVPDKIFDLLLKKNKGYVATGTDAELYGLRYLDQTAKYEKLLKQPGFSTIKISDYLSSLTKTKKVKLTPSSWESTTAEIKKGLPYAVWNDPKNKIQTKLWQLAKMLDSLVINHKNDKNYQWSRWHLVRGLASCTFWWASGKDFGHVFGPIAWNPDEIEKNINELIRSARSLQSVSVKNKIKVEKLAHQIKEMIWTEHWQKYNKKLLNS